MLPVPDILLTGGTGFVGRSLLTRLVDEKKNVRVLTRHIDRINKSIPSNPNYLTLVKGNVSNKEDLLNAAQGVKCIIHLAAAMGGDWAEHKKNTIDGTNNVLQVCNELSIPRLIYISTLNVYHAENYKQTAKIDESFGYEQHPERRGFYSAAKLAAEKQVVDYANDNPARSTIIFRPGLIYGPGLNPLLNDLGIQIGKKLIICLGNGKRKLPLVYVVDIADALFKANQSASNGKQIYNLVDKTYPTQRDYLRQYNQISGKRLILVPIPYALCKIGLGFVDFVYSKLIRSPKNLVYRLQAIQFTPCFSIDRAKKELNWNPDISLAEALSAIEESQHSG